MNYKLTVTKNNTPKKHSTFIGDESGAGIVGLLEELNMSYVLAGPWTEARKRLDRGAVLRTNNGTHRVKLEACTEKTKSPDPAISFRLEVTDKDRKRAPYVAMLTAEEVVEHFDRNSITPTLPVEILNTDPNHFWIRLDEFSNIHKVTRISPGMPTYDLRIIDKDGRVDLKKTVYSASEAHDWYIEKTCDPRKNRIGLSAFTEVLDSNGSCTYTLKTDHACSAQVKKGIVAGKPAETAEPNLETQQLILAFENSHEIKNRLDKALKDGPAGIDQVIRKAITGSGGSLTWPNATLSKWTELKAKVNRELVVAHFVKRHFGPQKPPMPPAEYYPNDETRDLILAFENSKRVITDLENEAQICEAALINCVRRIFNANGARITWPHLQSFDEWLPVKTKVDIKFVEEHFVNRFIHGKTPVTNAVKLNQQEPPAMKSLTLKTVTYLNGGDVSQMSDEQLIESIRGAEADIANMEKIVNKPKKLQAKIDQLNAEIKTLVDYIDTRAAK